MHKFLRCAPIALLFRTGALLLALSFVFSPSSGAMWRCEGRVCGISAMCCCVLPTEKTDALCQADATQREHLGSVLHAQEAGPCTQDCHCTMVVQSKDSSSQRWKFALQHTPQFALLPSRVQLLNVPLSQHCTQALSQRGPPICGVQLSFPSLRAPPVA